MPATEKAALLSSSMELKERRKTFRFFFDDNERCIDYMLAYQPSNEDSKEEQERAEAREYFLENLKKEGLLLEEANDASLNQVSTLVRGPKSPGLFFIQSRPRASFYFLI